MRLKSLELQGYKSFATKALFEFEGGITAIVGPNGSGKSNVSDSIRWVLGEQSYVALRGRKTEDMIFSGSDGRARLGMAQATLVFDNGDGWLPVDFTEVTITRRAYRDGQNEYLLNGSRVRLRDINDLLASSGLSRRTYTHIGQGLVDAVLSLRAEERRSLFEEAAGITLHNTRRAEALSRLDATQENLLRLNDIVAEITPRMKYLERQAERAATYQTVENETREHLRIWYGYQWNVGLKRLAAARADVIRSRRRLEEERARSAQAVTGIEDLRSQHNQLRLQLGEWHLESSRLHKEAEVVQRDLAVGEERSRLIAGQVAEIQAELEPLNTVRDAVADKVRITQTAEDAMIVELDSARQRVADLRAQLAGVHSSREALLRRQSDAQRQSRALAGRLAGHEARLGNVAERRRQLTAEKSEAEGFADAQQKVLDEAAPRRDQVEATLRQVSADLASLADERTRCLDAIRDTSELVSQMEEKVALQKQRLEASRARQDLLSRMQQEMVGYYEGVRSLLAAGASLTGIIGTVTQLLSVPAELETAIETALGAHLQDVVVQTWSNAEAAIAHLKRNHGGRATFLPLDTIRPGGMVKVPPGKGILGVAAGLVECNTGIRPVAEFLLGRTVVVDDLPVARRVLDSLQGGFQIVTLEGDLVRSGGSVSGGSVSKNKGSGGFLARQREWKELPDLIATQESDLSQAIAGRDQAKGQLSAMRSQLDALAGRQSQLQEKQAATDKDWRAVQRDVERAQQAAGWQQTLLARIQRQWDDVDRDEQTLKAEVAQLSSEQLQLDSLAKNLSDQIDALGTDPLSRQLSQAEAEQAAIEGRHRSQRTILDGHRAHLEQISGQIEKKHRRVSELTEEKQQLDARLDLLRRRSQSLNDSIAALAARIDPTEVELSALEEQRILLERQDNEHKQLLQRQEAQAGQLGLELSRRQDERKLLERQIAGDLGLVEMEDVDDSASQPPLPLHPLISKLPRITELPEGLEETIHHLRAQLGRMGSVNLDAPKEYEETRDRHAFLIHQMADLEKASADLRQVISELDRIMEEEFLKTFRAVAVEFRKYFKQLFNGGEAELQLTDPEKLADTGIEIVARPPGKRAQNLNMLSGGERSLTAAALIFALLKASPTPFCILDEVDAMLDEANVGRFRGVLEELSKDTQFIVISHNRRTVEVASTIYGISMGEDSVSRSVSLRLDEVE